MKFLRRLFSTPLVWQRVRQSRVLIYGPSGSEIIKNYLAEEASIYRHPEHEINIWVAVAAISRLQLSREGYLHAYLRMVRPSVVITMEDNDLLFYRIQALNPTCSTLAIQNGRRDHSAGSQAGGFFEQASSLRACREIGATYIAVFGAAIGNLYTESLGIHESRVIPIGSIRNNAVAETEPRYESRIIYISSMPNFALGGHPESDERLAYYHGSPVTYRENWLAEKLAVTYASQFAHNSNRPFVVLGKRSSMHGGESQYYSELLRESKWSFIPCEDQASSYRYITHDDICVAVDGTLAYEMFGRGYRVAFLSGRLKSAGLGQFRDCNFGFPLVLPNRGPFWTDEISTSEVERVLGFVSTSDEEEWENATGEWREQLMVHDPMNERLCDLLEELGVATTGPRYWQNALIPSN